MAKTIVLIHGAWMTPLCWEFFKARYEQKGHAVIAPPWPHEDLAIEELRAHPPEALRHTGIPDIAAHYERIVRALPEAPIIMGHSTGGLIAQLLLDRGLGASGVAIDPVPIRGVPAGPRILRSAWPVFRTPGFWNKVLPMSFNAFATTFAQTLPEDQKRAAYERYWAPTPGRIYLQGALGIGTAITPGNPRRPPLLMTAGEKDITMTPFNILKSFHIQRRTPSVTQFRLFKGLSHFLIAEPGWEAVADFCLNWAVKNARG
jgi:pimeloyl-ACP methyl ester carboxylesterase